MRIASSSAIAALGQRAADNKSVMESSMPPRLSGEFESVLAVSGRLNRSLEGKRVPVRSSPRCMT